MFAKLLKHEWKSSWGVLSVLTLSAAGVGVLGAILLAVLNNFDYDSLDYQPFLSLVVFGIVMTLGLCMIALGVYLVAVQIILLYRFYKNKFTDEGYLTFTLPVKTEHIYWSSILNMLIWTVLSSLTVLAVVILAVLVGVGDWNALVEILEGFEMLLSILEFYPGTQVLSVLTILVSVACGLALPLACIAGGAVLAKKHKILAAFGVYYAVNFILGIVSSVISFMPTVFLMAGSPNMSADAYMNLSMGLTTLLMAGLTVASYFITIHLMKHKLNLP